MILPGPSLNSHEISNSLRLLMTRFRKLMLIPPSHLSLSTSPPPPPLLLSPAFSGYHLSGPPAVELYSPVYTLLSSLLSLSLIHSDIPPQLKPT